MALVDTEARFVYVNPAYVRLLKEVFNLTVGPGSRHQYVLPNSQRAWASDLYQRALSGKKFTVDFTRTCPEGGVCTFERSFSPVYHNGRLAGFSEVIRDVTVERRREAELRQAYDTLEKQITARTRSYQEYNAILAQEIIERQQAEEDLLESGERLSQILQGSSIPAFVIDENHTITHWNKACAVMTGLAAGEMVGTQNQWKAFYLYQRPVMADLVLDAAMESRIAKFYSGKYRPSALVKGAYEAEDFFDFGHESKWLFFTAAPIKNLAGDIIGAIETLQDITDRKRMEAEVRRMNDALEARVEERTNQLSRTYEQLLHAEKFSAVGKLAASIAHEFGNPIIGIRNFLQGLRKHVKLEKGDAEMLDVAIGECARVKDLISTLQDFNRPTTGKVASVDLHRIIEELLLLGKKKLSDRHITVERHFAAGAAQDSGGAGPDQAGAPQRDRQRRGGHPRKRRDHHHHHRGGRGECPDSHPGYGQGHPAEGSGLDLRAVFLNQAGGGRHRPGVVRELRHCQAARRRYHGQERARQRGAVHHHPAHRRGPWRRGFPADLQVIFLFCFSLQAESTAAAAEPLF